MRTLLTATAVPALLAGAALADAHGAMFPDVHVEDGEAYLASDLMGTRIHVTDTPVAIGQVLPPGAAAGFDDIGAIGDVVISAEGGFEAVIVDVGGFLGLGAREVAVAWSAIIPVLEEDDPDDVILVLPVGRAALEAAPEFRRADAPPRATGDVLADDTVMMAEGTEVVTVPLGAEFDADAASTEEELDELNAEIEAAEAGAAAATLMADADPLEGDAPGVVADPVVADPEEPLPEVSATGAVIEEEALPRATEPVMLPQPAFTRDGYETVAREALTEGDLEGLRVYDAADEDVGEVDEVILGADGLPDGVVLDIGGFLGLGEHSVLVTIDRVQVLRGATDARLYIDATRERLEALPEYEG